jgi:hypothetical protein
MHLSWISLMADAAILPAGGLAGLYCCLVARPDRVVRVRWKDLGAVIALTVGSRNLTRNS